ncbi:MAG TPA: hypothetical protein VGI54_12690 [Solirubrobacteraceae bacterium]
MPNITGLPAVDVAIGLSFVYLLFSLAVSGVNEAIASLFALRSRDLQRGICNLLDDPEAEHPESGTLVAELQRHPVVAGLTKGRAGHEPKRPWRRPWPAYLPSRAFSRALLDTIAPVKGIDETRDALQRVRDALKAEPAEGALKDAPASVRMMLTTAAIEAAGSATRFRSLIETQFDDAMDRVSGWYKRRAQLILTALAIVATCALNVDSLKIANALWNDQTLRQAVVVQAQAAAKDTADATSSSNGVRTAAKAVTDVEQLKLPFGWTSPPSGTQAKYDQGDPRVVPTSFGGWLLKLAGLLITILAVSLGGPFWFDALNRLVRLRGTGPVPKRHTAPAA